MEEGLLFQLKIDGAGSDGIIDKFKQSVIELTKATENLKSAQEEDAKQKQLNEQIIEKQNEAIKKTKQAIDAEEGSIAKLREANKKLTAERNATSTATEEGRKKIASLNAQLDQNNKTIKENVDAYTKQKIGVGGYREALEGLIPGLGGVTRGVEATNASMWKLVANPIGLILAAIALALAAVISYFKGSEEGADKFAKVSAQASAIIGVLTDRLIAVGDALVSFLSGDWEAGVNKMTGAFSGLGDEINREVALATELAEILDTLEEMELRQSIAISKTANEIKLLLIQAKDRTKTERERIALQQEALDLEKKQAGEIQAIQLARLSATARQMQADFSQHAKEQQAGETTLQFVERLIKNESILYDKRKELGELLIQYNRTQGDSLNVQEKILNQQDLLLQKAIDKTQKEKEAKEKADKEEAERKKKSADDQEKLWNTELAKHFKNIEEKEAADKEYHKGLADLRAKEQEEKDKARLKEIEDERKAIEEKLAMYNAASNVILGILSNQSRTASMETNAQVSKVQAAERKKLTELEKRFKTGLISEEAYNKAKDQITAEATEKERALKKKGFEAQKKNQIAATIISTLQSAVNAFQSLSVIPIVGPVLGGIAAAAALVFGYKQVEAIKKTEFAYATGGISGTRIMPHHGRSIHRSNGDNLLATVKTGEVILNEQQQAKLGGARTFASIGVPGFAAGGFTGGQIETRTVNQTVSDREILNRISDQLANQPRQVLVLQDFEAVQDAKNAVEVKSTF